MAEQTSTNANRIMCADVHFENGEVVHMRPDEMREALRLDRLHASETKPKPDHFHDGRPCYVTH